MPPYFSVEVGYSHKSLNKNFVDRICSFIFTKFPFKNGYWNSESNSLLEIINWNQQLLEKRFILGYDEHVSNNYKQLLLSSELYTHMRMYWGYRNDKISLSIIIPEYEILVEEGKWQFREEKINPIIDLCQDLWEQSPVEIIQSCLEMDGGPISIGKIRNGELPSINPIAILNRDYSKTIYNLNSFKLNTELKEIENNGIMIIANELIRL
ncbi:hypothetical protein AB4114_35235 [Paenibacillus sp. 2RAB27]|uniref:hypothetical protein n=1 Tax=Paenibacillus sp. 2RAB27 TaxID=3232991 RepID=UPI003F973018